MTDNNQLLDQLNPAQRKAVLHFESPLLIIAGAGSGKTKVITNKIAYLVREKGYSPYNILGVTFTNKAAAEMKHRIEGLTAIDARQFNISTFHSLGLRILRESGSVVGFDDNWQIMDEGDQKKIVERIIKENFNHFTSDMRDTVKRKIGFAKMELNYPNNREYLLQKGFTDDEVKIYTLYFAYQRDNKLWDYEDLVSFPVKLLQTNEEIRKKYADKFKYVVVDEFQDTNPNQFELLTLLAGDHQNIMVVGDDDQAVYSWRGASIRFLFQFEQDFPGTRIIKLEQNYRSTPQVLDFANNLIEKNTQRRDKTMFTEAESGNPVFLLDTRSKEDEARETANLIARLKDEAPDMFPLAILYRINSQSLAFETEFARRNIDFKILKGLRFFDRKEIKDSLALLRVVINPDDDIAFLRIVDFLPLGIGAKSQDSLSRLARDYRISMFQALKNYTPEKYKSRDLFDLIYRLNQKFVAQQQCESQPESQNSEIKLSSILKTMLKASGYLEVLEEKGDQGRILNIDELMAFIEKWEQENAGDDSFNRLMDYISLESGQEKDTDETSVFLLTMHNAKGLEFPTVVVSGINTSYMPFFLRKDLSELEEERRLFYVAATRAIKQLVISFGSDKRSPFLNNVKPSLYSMAYSIEDILHHISPVKGGRDRLSGLLEQAAGTIEEKFIEHPIFGRGKILNAIDEDKFIVEFVDRGEKTIDTSVVPVTFL
jgi:DNA helicase II / ATP-dependent DNA helicase PcrA